MFEVRIFLTRPRFFSSAVSSTIRKPFSFGRSTFHGLGKFLKRTVVSKRSISFFHAALKSSKACHPPRKLAQPRIC